jgi:hypothetical protein
VTNTVTEPATLSPPLYVGRDKITLPSSASSPTPPDDVALNGMLLYMSVDS